jgi:poly(A) polymerase/tRNA nucleotidyltransferase (CCA-adding enzyme)
MSVQQKANLLALVRKYQNKNKKTDIYYSLSTCVKLIMDEEVVDIFTVSFNNSAKLPRGIIHKHVLADIDKFTSFQPFKLDTMLISVKTGKIIDKFDARSDIDNKIVDTVKEPDVLLKNKPFLSIRAAALIAETGFSPSSRLMESSKKYAGQLKHVNGKTIWKELKRVLRAERPSSGINFLYETGVLSEILPELEACFGVEQNTKYHKYTVYEHCLKACDACVRDDVNLRFSALIHDIGKPNAKGHNDKGITFHKHEVFSTKLARKIVSRLKLKKKSANFVTLLVSNHMYQYDRVWKNSTVKKFIRKVGLTKEYIGRLEEFPLFQLRQADRRGRGLNPVTQKQLDFEDRLNLILESM